MKTIPKEIAKAPKIVLGVILRGTPAALDEAETRIKQVSDLQIIFGRRSPRKLFIVSETRQGAALEAKR